MHCMGLIKAVGKCQSRWHTELEESGLDCDHALQLAFINTSEVTRTPRNMHKKVYFFIFHPAIATERPQFPYYGISIDSSTTVQKKIKVGA